MVAFNVADLDEGSFKCCRLVKESWSVPRQKQKEMMISERTTGGPSSRLEKITWGTKYGRFTTINISKYEHFTRKINKTYSHPVSPLWFLAISAVSSVFSPHCYSCPNEKGKRKTTRMI